MKQYMIDYWTIKEVIDRSHTIFSLSLSEPLMKSYQEMYCRRRIIRNNHAARDLLNDLNWQYGQRYYELTGGRPPLLEMFK